MGEGAEGEGVFEIEGRGKEWWERRGESEAWGALGAGVADDGGGADA
jgi:hypothetical protein